MTDTNPPAAPSAPAAPAAPAAAPAVAGKPPAKKPAAKKASGKTIMVRTVKPMKLHCHPQGIMILPGTVTQVANDDWIAFQVKSGTLEVVK